MNKNENNYSLYNNIPLGICILKDDLSVIFWNTFLEDLTGISALKIIGSTIGDFFPLLNTKEYSFQDVFLGKSSELFYHQTHRKPFFVKDSNFKISLSRTQDVFVTPVKCAENSNKYNALISVKSINCEGETFVELNEDLSEANDEIKRLKLINTTQTKSSSSLERYFYSVGNDLKEPLRAIKTFSEFVLEDFSKTMNPIATDYLKRVVKGSERMFKLINDLIKISIIGRKYVEFVKVDLNELLDYIKLDLFKIIKRTKAKIIISRMPKIICQRTWLSEVFKNLIINAITYNISKPPQIFIDYEENNKEFIFSIKDNGIGIEKKYHKSILNRFQMKNKLTSSGKSGLGLSIVSAIIHEQSGRIWVDKSSKRNGTIFKFTIPKKNKENI